jgi:hypothetical protein
MADADTTIAAPTLSDARQIEQTLRELNETLDRTLADVKHRQQSIDRYARESDEVLARLLSR